MPRVGAFRPADLRQARDFDEIRAALDTINGVDLAFIQAPQHNVALVPDGMRRGVNLFGPGRSPHMTSSPTALYPVREVASVLLHGAGFVASSMSILDRQDRLFLSGIENLGDPKRLAAYDPHFRLDEDGELYLADDFRLRAQHLNVIAIPVCGPGFPNYGHFLYDGLPAIFQHRDLLNSPNVRIVGQRLLPWQQAILDALNLGGCYLEVRQPVVFYKTLATTLLSMHVSYPTPLIRPMFEFLREHIAGPLGRAERRVFFSRGGAGRRLLRNHTAIEASLARLGFEIVRPELLSFTEQVRLMSTCRIMVGESGAAMANLGFCPPGTAVLEIQPERFVEGWIRSMCFMLGHHWHVYFAAVEPPSPADAAEAERARDGDFSYEIDPADLEQAVREMELRTGGPGRISGAAAGAARPAEASPDPAMALRELRGLMAAGQVAAARQICETVFAARPDATDEFGHPVYLKESLRLALAAGDMAGAQTAASALQARMASSEPLVHVLYARHFAKRGDREAARRQWRAALVRDPRLAEAGVWLAADAEIGPAPTAPALATGIGGLADVTFADTGDLAQFALTGQDERLRLFTAPAPPAQLPLHDETNLDPAVVAEHHRLRPSTEGAVYAITGCQLSAIGLLTRDGRFFHREDCLPDYFVGWLNKVPHALPLGLAGSLDLRDAEVMRLDHPVATAFHPNVIWGHFLVEMLPRLFLVDLLARLGRPIPLAAPSDAPEWIKRFAVTYGAAGGLIWYDPKQHRLEAPAFVVPNMMQVDWALSPMLNLVVSDLFARCGLAESSVPEGPRLLYLSRDRITWTKRLVNEPAVEEMLQGMGFAVVHPETLPLPEQLRLFRAAEVIVAEYGSVLHNTLFARPGTRVVAINRHNWLQGEIARIRRQTLAYVRPADGVWRDPTKQGDARKFSVDLPTLRRVVQEIIELGRDGARAAAGSMTTVLVSTLPGTVARGAADWLPVSPATASSGVDELSAGPYLRDLETAGLAARTFVFAESELLHRKSFFYAEPTDPAVAPFGVLFADASYNTYFTSRITCSALAGASVVGASGLICFDGRLVKDTVHSVDDWRAESIVAHRDLDRGVRFKERLPLPGRRLTGQYFGGITGAWRNHAHWLTEGLPMLYLYRWLRLKVPELRLLLPDFGNSRIHTRTIELLGLDSSEIMYLAESDVVRPDILWCAPGISLWSVPRVCGLAAQQLVRAVLTGNNNLFEQEADRIYLRRLTPVRRVANFEDIRHVLHHFGFRIVSMETMTLDDQISTMQRARYIIGEHGAGLANVMFCNPGARVLELFNPAGAQPTYWVLSSLCDLDYGYMIGQHAPALKHVLPDGNTDYYITAEHLTKSVQTLTRE